MLNLDILCLCIGEFPECALTFPLKMRWTRRKQSCMWKWQSNFFSIRGTIQIRLGREKNTVFKWFVNIFNIHWHDLWTGSSFATTSGALNMHHKKMSCNSLDTFLILSSLFSVRFSCSLSPSFPRLLDCPFSHSHSGSRSRSFFYEQNICLDGARVLGINRSLRWFCVTQRVWVCDYTSRFYNFYSYQSRIIPTFCQ